LPKGTILKTDFAEKPALAELQWSNGGESLAAPRGVSDASRRCKQRPSKFLIEGRFVSRIVVRASIPIEK
jgi:hypothetical protein